LRDINRIELIGRAGADPKVHQFDNGGEVVEFSLATKESWKDKKTGEWKDRTTWHKVKAFSPKNGGRGIVGTIEGTIFKGSTVRVLGQQTHREYDKNGEKRYSAEVLIPPYWGEVDLMEKKSDEFSNVPAAISATHQDAFAPISQPQTNAGVDLDLDDDVPF